MRPKSIVAILVPAALAFAGCGGDDDSGGQASRANAQTPAPALSKAEYIRQADAICAEVNAALGAVQASSAEPAAEVGQVADLYSGMVERLRDLGTPDDADGLDAFLAAAGGLAQSEQDAELAAARGDSEGLAAAEAEASEAFESYSSAAESFGFQDCGQGASAVSTGAADGDADPDAPTSSAPGTPDTGGADATPDPAPAPEPPPAAGNAGGTAPSTGGSGGGGEGGGTGGGTPSGGVAPSSGGIGPG